MTMAAATLSPEAADALRPVLPGLADDIVEAISAEVPDYARPMEGAFGQTVRVGVQVALNRFVDLLMGSTGGTRRARETYVRLGRGEFHAGRSLDALLAAYRVGARLAWRRFVEAGTRAGFPPDALYDLGEAIFSYIDEISAESAAGYAEAQSAAAGESQRRRQDLVRLLAQEPPPPAEAVRTAALTAAWALPRMVAAIVAAEIEQQGDGADVADEIAAALARRLGADAVGAAVGGLAVVMMSDPDGPGRRRALENALAGERAALGPAVPWTEAAASVRRAAAAFRLAEQGRLDGTPPPGGVVARSTGESSPSSTVQSSSRLVVADEHLPALLLAAEPALAADLARTRLAPLDGLGAAARERLVATLRAWLDRPGQVQAVAAALEVHPQTVRYRLKQLRELFGARLEDPDTRFELALALRAADAVRYS